MHGMPAPGQLARPRAPTAVMREMGVEPAPSVLNRWDVGGGVRGVGLAEIADVQVQ